MSNLQKIVALCIVLAAIAVGGFFLLNASSPGKSGSSLVVSDYGFSFSVPNGWHVWEGSSAAFELLNETAFLSDLESGLASEKAKEYQRFMDKWNAESAKQIVFTNAQFDYKDRDLADAGKIASTLIDSEEMLAQKAITMTVSPREVGSEEDTVNYERGESGYIKIDDSDALFLRVKNLKLVDRILVSVPLVSNKTIEGEKVQSLIFSRYVRKDDPAALSDLVSFISELKITTGP